MDPAKVERAVDEELARFLAAGPTAGRARARQDARPRRLHSRRRAHRRLRRQVGRAGQGQVFAGRPDYYKVRLGRMAAATAAQVRAAAAAGSSDGDYTLEVRPFPDYATAPHRRRPLESCPSPAPPPKAEFPALERATLSNGLKIVLAGGASIPQVRFDLLLDAGFAADQFAHARHGQPGHEHARRGHHAPARRSRSATASRDLGATLGTASRLDVSSVSLEALTEQLDPSLELYADVILHPAFRPADLERLRKQRLAQIQREKADPVGMALRVFPRVVYGEGHAYANPWTGSGTEASTAKITRADLVKFHETWFKPNHATLVVVGRHDHGGDPAPARAPVRRLEAGRRAAEEHRRRAAAHAARRSICSTGPARCSPCSSPATSRRPRPTRTSRPSRP